MSAKISLEEWLKLQEDFYENHVKYHPANAFCGNAGPAEQRHIESLIDDLSDSELEQLVAQSGIRTNTEFDRALYEEIVDEIDREDFYTQYEKIIQARKHA